MACLEIYRELLLFATFLRVHSTSRTYPTSFDKMRILA